MKRFLILLCLSVMPILAAWADSYKILHIEGSKSINIGGRRCTKGDVFSDNDTIVWASNEQIIAVCPLDGKNRGRTIRLSARAFARRQARTLYRYVNMIGRGEAEVPIVVLGRGDSDTLPVVLNPAFGYQLWFDTVTMRVEPRDGRLILDREMFGTGGRMVDAWIAQVNPRTGDMHPAYHCLVDLAVAAGDERTPPRTAGEKRLALVVGNANYLDPQDRLSTPIEDGRRVSLRLEELGFRVIGGFDKNYQAMAQTIDMFSSLSVAYDVALFYYSGHGAQGRERSGDIENYIVPTNIAARANDDVTQRCIPLGRISDALARPATRCAVRMLFFDACRNIPAFSTPTRGGTVAAEYPDCWAFFATSAGSRADDGQGDVSPFTQAWLDATSQKHNSLGSLHTAISSRLKELTRGEQKASFTCNSSSDWVFSPKGEVATPAVAKKQAEPGMTAYRQATALFAEEKYDEAVKLFIIAAEEGNIQAQGALGYCYYYGRGVAVDYEEAVRWYFQAALGGLDYAQNGLGMCYMNGKGVEPNYTEAVRWYRAAALQGDQYAQYFLGLSYSLGLGTTQDYTQAARWFSQSARQGNADAQEALASCYLGGFGVDKDRAAAIEWYTKAARGGNASAQKQLQEWGLSW